MKNTFDISLSLVVFTTPIKNLVILNACTSYI